MMLIESNGSGSTLLHCVSSTTVAFKYVLAASNELKKACISAELPKSVTTNANVASATLAGISALTG